MLPTLSTVEQSMGQWGRGMGRGGGVNRGKVSPEVHHNLFCPTHIEGQVICTTPFGQPCHFLSVVHFIVVFDETYHCCKLDDVFGAELGSAVVSQQREEQWAEHTALWGTRTCTTVW